MNRPLISIDPSITCTGIAVFNKSCELIDGGLIKTKDRFTHDRVRYSVKSIDRIDELIAALGDWLTEYQDAQFSIEVTSGKTSSRHGGGGAGLGTYGMVVGHVARWAICKVGNDRVHQVYENDWTRGSKKDRRKTHAELTYPLYAQRWAAEDKGGDLADAIGVGDYTMNQINLGVIEESEMIG